MEPPTLLAVPNFSEGRSPRIIEALGRALSAGGADGAQGAATGVRLLDVHSDRDHHRSVFTLAGAQGALAAAVLEGARVAAAHIDVIARERSDPAAAGAHPHVGALDVAPFVYLDEGTRGAACAEALVLADRLGEELEIPVFLYGELSAETPDAERTRAGLRRGGIEGLAARMQGLVPDFGPPRLHPSAGATLVAARQPLVAFNLVLAPGATLVDARRIAAAVREGAEHGLPGLRAIGVPLSGGSAQVSMNVERPLELSLAEIVEAVAAHAPLASAELVGLAPAAALRGFPEGLLMPGFDPARHLIENALGS